MTDYSELLERLQLLIGDDANNNSVYKQVADAIKCLLAQHKGRHEVSSSLEEPTDHEAEGAMRYVISRGA